MLKYILNIFNFKNTSARQIKLFADWNQDGDFGDIDESYPITQTITNSTGATKVFWFGVRSSAAQPTRFQLGESSSLLAGVTLEATITINLEPDSPLGGYIAEPYTLYGFNFQPGSAFVSIGI